MKSKVILISLVFVALALSFSGISALNFKETGQTGVSSVEGDVALEGESGDDNVCILKKNGNVECFASSSSSGSYSDYSGGDAKKVSVNPSQRCVLRDNGKVDGCTYSYPNSNDITDISSGYSASTGSKFVSVQYSARCAINDSETVYCSGSSRAFADSGSLDGHSASRLTTFDSVSVGGYLSCVIESTSSFGSGNDVNCFGDAACPDGAAGPCVKDYNKGDAKQVSVGDGYYCVLKDNANGNGGNVECKGDYPSDSQIINYTKGDAKQVEAEILHTCVLKDNANGNGGNVECWGDNSQGQSQSYTGGDAVDLFLGITHTCIVKESGDVQCWGESGSSKTGNYTYNRTPDYSGFSINSEGESNGKIKVNSSINWKDSENKFNLSYMEHNFSGSPQNITNSTTSPSIVKSLGPGNYYVKFYGEDEAGKTNSTGKKFFEISKSSSKGGSSSFYWEDTSGNKISSVSITDSKNVTMVANYSGQGPAGSSKVDFDVLYGYDNYLMTKYNVDVQSVDGSDYAEKEVNITSSWAYTYSNLSFEIKGQRSNNLSANCQNCAGGGQTCSTLKTNISCVPKKDDCGGSLMDKTCISGLCCNFSDSSGSTSKALCEQNPSQYNHCEDYKSPSACKSNTCDLPPLNEENCESGSCECWWNSTGPGNEGVCRGINNGSENDNMPDDGFCVQISNSSDTCEDDGVLETSWKVQWKNTSSGETYTKQSKIPASCQPGSRTTTCPSVAKLPGENNFTIPLTILAMTLAYVVYWNRREE